MPERLNLVLIDFVDFARTRVNALATTKYMQDGGFGALGDSSKGEFATRGTPNTSSILRIQTGRLARSITGNTDDTIDTFTVEGGKLQWTKGTDVPYAGMHENGFSGSVNIPAHTRIRTNVFGRPTEAYTQNVREHTRDMMIPARPFLSPAIRDFEPMGVRYFETNQEIIDLLSNLNESE